MIDLGNETEGTAALALPTPHDGDDLEIHLIYELMPVVPEPVDTGGENEETEENDTPFVSVVSTVLTVGLAVAFIRTGRQAR